MASRQSLIFIGDNGRVSCWGHTGASIRANGHDTSGQEAVALTMGEAAEFGIQCEDCRLKNEAAPV